MGRKSSPPPNIIKAPPAKTPTLTQVPTQSPATLVDNLFSAAVA